MIIGWGKFSVQYVFFVERNKAAVLTYTPNNCSRVGPGEGGGKGAPCLRKFCQDRLIGQSKLL